MNLPSPVSLVPGIGNLGHPLVPVKIVPKPAKPPLRLSSLGAAGSIQAIRFAHHSSLSFTMSKQTDYDVIFVGCGFGSVCTLAKWVGAVQSPALTKSRFDKLGLKSHIYERNARSGGVWSEASARARYFL